MNKILFESQLNRIKNNSIKKYFLNFFKLKNLIIKLIIFFLFSFTIFASCFAVRGYYLNFQLDTVAYNKGFAFSSGSNWSVSIVYLVQALPSAIAIVLFIFVNPKIIYIPLLFVAIGGFSNVIDRAILDPVIATSDGINTVVDYIHAPGSIFNLPDMFVVGGAIICAVNTFIYCLYQINNENEKNKK